MLGKHIHEIDTTHDSGSFPWGTARSRDKIRFVCPRLHSACAPTATPASAGASRRGAVFLRAAGGLTVNTGQGAFRRTDSATLPKISRDNAVRPCVPMT